MTHVVMLGYGGPPPSAIGHDLVRTPVDGSLDALHELLATCGSEPIVALYPAAYPDPWLHHIQVLRSSLETRDLVPAPLDLPPLAGAIASGLVAVAATQREPDEVLGVIDRAAALVSSFGWLGSVGNLTHLPVAMKLHARSALPGTAFVAVATGHDRRVLVANRREPTLPLPLPDPSLALTVSVGASGDAEPVMRALTSASWFAAVTRVGQAPLGPSWWGTDRHVEVAVHPANRRPLDTALQGMPDAVSCPACGRRGAPPACPFCHHAIAGVHA